MNFLRTYLLAAIVVYVLCTLIILHNCTCSIANDSKEMLKLGIHKRSTDFPNVVSKLPETFLLVVIMSSPNSSVTRAVIRDTWLKLSTKGPDVVRHLFPIGMKGISASLRSHIDEEEQIHRDLAILDSLEENYANLAKKTLNTMEYAYQNYKFQYLLKVDSDSFVRLGAIIKSLKDIQHPRLYWGFLDGRAKPIRKGKWKESEWILCDRYLPYQLGGGYVLSYELVRFLALNSQMFKLYKNEDVSVGAWLAGLNIKYIHDPRFDTEWTSRGCNNQYLITHKKSPRDMELLYSNLVSRRVLCEKEFRVRYSYVYDWAALPSECCKRINETHVP